MIAKLLTEHHLEFISLKGGCRGSSESTLVKMPHCWKSHIMACFFLPTGHWRGICGPWTCRRTCSRRSSLWSMYNILVLIYIGWHVFGF